MVKRSIVFLAGIFMLANLSRAADDPAKLPKLDPRECWTKQNRPDWVGEPVAVQLASAVSDAEEHFGRSVRAGVFIAISLKSQVLLVDKDRWEDVSLEVRDAYPKMFASYFKARGGSLEARVFAGNKLIARWPVPEADLKKQKDDADAAAAKAAIERVNAAAYAKASAAAAQSMVGAKSLLRQGQKAKGIERLQMIVKDYPATDAADEARALLKRLIK